MIISKYKMNYYNKFSGLIEDMSNMRDNCLSSSVEHIKYCSHICVIFSRSCKILQCV